MAHGEDSAEGNIYTGNALNTLFLSTEVQAEHPESHVLKGN